MGKERVKRELERELQKNFLFFHLTHLLCLSQEMAGCCLFVALKVEEKVMKMETFLKWANHVKHKLLRWVGLKRERERERERENVR